MKKPIMILSGAVALGLSMVFALPAGRTLGRFRVASEPLCRGAASAPASIVDLPHFAEALRNEGRVRILAIGSSSTEGIGASNPGENYPSQLRAALDKALPDVAIEVVNLGIGGEVASQTALRLREAAPRLNPDLILWQVGTNDGLVHVPPAQYEATLRDSLDFLQGENLDVVLVGMQWSRKFANDPGYRAIVEATEKLARARGVALVSRYDAMRTRAEATGREEFLSADRLHMNDLGYHCLAEQIAATFSRARELSTPLEAKNASPSPSASDAKSAEAEVAAPKAAGSSKN